MSEDRRAILRAQVLKAATSDIGPTDQDRLNTALQLSGLFFDELMETLDQLARIADALEGIERQMGGAPGMRR